MKFDVIAKAVLFPAIGFIIALFALKLAKDNSVPVLSDLGSSIV